MSLAVSRQSSRKFRVISTLMMTLALIAQPFYVAVSTQVANAVSANVDNVVISPASTSIEVDQAKEFTLKFRDGTTNEALDSPATVELSSTSTTGEFAEGTSTSNPWTSGTATYTSSAAATMKFRYKDSAPGAPTIAANVSGGGLTDEYTATTSVTVEAASPSEDTEAPVISNPTPGNGAVVSGMVTPKVTVTDNVGVTRVQVSVYRAGTTDVAFGQPVNNMTPTSTANQYRTAQIDTNNLDDGNYDVVYSAKDAAGNQASELKITVMVDNVPDAPAPVSPGPAVKKVVSSNTYDASTQSGWMFNRDASTSTEYNFSDTQASIGNGSLYVAPIDGSINGNNDKFIGEYFTGNMAVSDFLSMKYDYQIAGNGQPGDADDFYVNVHANFPGHDGNYGDCKFDYVPLSGTPGSFTSYSFSASDTPHRVRGANCPATLADMSAGSTIFFAALNVGGTSASDTGLGGYYDNVILTTAAATTTFDFEPADTAAPTVSNIIIEPTANGNTGKTTTISFDVDDATGVDSSKTKVLFSDGPNDANRAKESRKVSPTYVGDSRYTATIDTQDFVKNNYMGTYNLKFEVYDTLGNHKSIKPSSFRGILVDNAGPVIANVRVDKNPVKGEAEIRVKLSDPSGINPERGTYVRFTRGASTNGAASKSDNVKLVYNASADDYVATIDTTDFANEASGNYWLYVRAQDGIGNASANDSTRGVVVDNAGPDVSFTQPGVNKVVRGNMSVGVEAADENNLGAYCLKVDGGSCVNGGYTYHPANGSMPTVVVDTNTLTEGQHTLIAQVTDRLNNLTEITRVFIVDRTAPVVEITSPANDTTINGEVTIAGTISDDNPDHYYLVVKNSDGDVVAGPGTVNRANVQDYEWNTGNAADGTYTIFLSARDAAGNKNGSVSTQGSSVDTVTVIVDNTPPSLTLSAPIRNADGTYTFTGKTDDATSDVDVTLDGSSVGVVTPSSDGIFSFSTAAPLADGAHTFSASSTDAVGNTAAEVTSITFTATTPFTGGDGVEPADQVSTVPLPLATPSDNASTAQLSGRLPTDIITPAVTDDTNNTDENGQVLGAQDSNLKDTVGAISPSQDGWKIFGIAWYWWLLALAAIAAIWWFIAGYRRRNSESA